MNKDKWKTVQDNLDHVENKQTKRNVVRLNSGNSLAHEMTKCRLCYMLQENGRDYLCEAPLEMGGRVDVLVLDVEGGLALEIVESEGEESIESKKSEWPFKVKTYEAGTSV